eukprot:984791-Heterocapsa_arctica.AAC.1
MGRSSRARRDRATPRYGGSPKLGWTQPASSAPHRPPTPWRHPSPRQPPPPDGTRDTPPLTKAPMNG